MIFLIYGKDNFRVLEKMNQVQAKFVEKTGSEFNIEKFDENMSLSQFKNSLIVTNFLSAQKLIIVKNFLKKASPTDAKEIAKIIVKIPAEVTVVFVESELSPKNPVLKKVTEIGKVWQFEPLASQGILTWAKKRVEEKGGKIDFEAAETLTFFVGNDLGRLDLEIDKLIEYKDRKEIHVEDVRDLVKPQFSPSIFELIDSLAAKNLAKSQQILKNLLVAGENALYIHTMIVYQFRNLIIIKALSESGLGSAQIREKTRLHPFVIQKSLQQIRNFSLSNLKLIYQKLMSAEIAMKTGQIDPDFALELLVLGLMG
ncbi:MAG TPA: DNA polymerase III subunit delta [Patescibacteria group bacterium]|nr:DNA polymerase III subunit delta [Patescibacteria group bacterium]